MDIASGAETKISSTSDINLGSGAEVKVNGTKIFLNGPTNAETATAADFVKPYDLRDNLATSTAAGWDKRYQAGIVSADLPYKLQGIRRGQLGNVVALTS